MKFDFFLNIISKIEKIKVNTSLAHLEFLPENREQFALDYKTAKTRSAAVMPIIFPVKEEAHLALIVRTTYDGAHSGQVAFAGGSWEKEDDSFLETAFREVEEEIGVSKKELIYCKELTALYIPVSDFRVYPFLAYAKKPLTFIRQESEVSEIITFPLKELLSDGVKQLVTISIGNTKKIEAPAFVYKGYTVWGATAMILNELKQVIVKSMD